ncbi:MAG: hypothetical protein FWG17_06795 [Desulfovibrionaceae bacterium]|nr:hypothetical protein [Desulfovibrionaceae bacterium]
MQKMCYATLALLVSFCFAGSALASRPVPPQGWDGHDHYFWKNGEWDSAALPPCVPGEIPGVKVDNTTHKTKEHRSMPSDRNEVGSMYFVNSRYENWGLVFDCAQEQAEAFLKTLEGNGFFGGLTNEHQGIHEYIGNGYYAYARVRTNYLGSADQGGFDKTVIFMITPAVHQLPKSFNGWTLPQVGVALSPYDECEVMCWDDKGNDRSAKWDLRADRGKLPAKNWVAWFDYFGVSNEEAAAYARILEASGWKISWQNQEEGESKYSCQLKKGDTWALVFFDGAFRCRVGFSDVSEMLSY